MEYTFGELQTEGLAINNFDAASIGSGSTDTNLVTSIKLRINEAAARIGYHAAWEWRKRTFHMTLRAPYTTGSITVTQNSKTVTGSGTSWDDAMRIGYILLNGVAYKINRVSSTTSLVLESAYPAATASAQTYKIIFPDMHLNHRISSIINVKVAGTPIDVVSMDKLVYGIANPGLPSQCAISERVKEDWYNTGTVSVTAASSAVTGSGTAFSSEMEGMAFRVDEFSKKYTIKSVDSASSLTLTENYEGSTGSGKSFKINPTGTAMITFRIPPDDYYWVEIEALINIPKMINSNDISIIPHHAPLIEGTRWLAHDLKNENPVRIEQLAAEFKKSLKDLEKAYKSISNVRWISNDELRFRSNGMSGQFDPLAD